MARKTVSADLMDLCDAEDSLAKVGDGLGRICAIAELLGLANNDRVRNLAATVHGASSAIELEARQLNGILGTITNDLNLFLEASRTAKAPPALEVVNG